MANETNGDKDKNKTNAIQFQRNLASLYFVSENKRLIHPTTPTMAVDKDTKKWQKKRGRECQSAVMLLLVQHWSAVGAVAVEFHFAYISVCYSDNQLLIEEEEGEDEEEYY